MRQCVHTTDINEHANALPGWQQRYDQLSPGRLDGWLALAQVDGVQVFRERLNRSVVQSLRLPSQTLNILIPLAWPHMETHGDIRVLQPSLLPDHEELRVVSPAGMDVLCLSMPVATLACLLDEETLVRLHSASVIQRINVASGRFATDIKPLLAALDGELPPPAGLKTQLVLLAAEWLESLAGEPRAVPCAGTRRYIVDRCHQWLLEEYQAPPSVIDLCRRLKVSRRTLQYSFQSVAAVSPVHYLRSVRLNGARRSMHQQPQRGIADIAAHWGFEHPSYFSLEYQKLFGELPSVKRRGHPAQP